MVHAMRKLMICSLKPEEEEDHPLNKPRGVSVAVDYLTQFSSWTGYDVWINDLFASLKEPRGERSVVKKRNEVNNETIVKALDELLDVLPKPKSRRLTSRCPQDSLLLSNKDFANLEDDLLWQLNNKDLCRLYNEMAINNRSEMNMDIDNGKNYKVAGSVPNGLNKVKNTNRASKDPNGDKKEDKTKGEAKEAEGLKKKKSKEKFPQASKKSPKSSTPEEEPQTQGTLLQQLMSLYNQYEQIQLEKELLVRKCKFMEEPFRVESQVVAVPSKHIIEAYSQDRIYKIDFDLVNPRREFVIVVIDKVHSKHAYLFEVKGPLLKRLPPGGCVSYRIYFLSNEVIDVQATVGFLIRDPNQVISEVRVPIECISANRLLYMDSDCTEMSI